jgi:hypothetical protein
MRAWTAGVIVVLGALLVLTGLAALVLRALWSPPNSSSTVGVAPAPGTTWRGADGRLVRAARAMGEAERLIFWGVLLLLLGAVAAGAIGINLTANAGNH